MLARRTTLIEEGLALARQYLDVIVGLTCGGMWKTIVLGVALLLVTGVSLGGCEGDAPAVWCEGCGDVSADCEEKPTCELLGFGIYPEY